MTVLVHHCECGKVVGARSARCFDCHMKACERERHERRTLIAALWSDGLSTAEIAVRLQRSGRDSVAVEMQRMRAAGWDLPFRGSSGGRRGGAGGRPRVVSPTKDQARQQLSTAIQLGRIVKPKTCGRCGEEAYVDGHHHDYSKPLDVEWLCRSCHMAHHRRTWVAA